MIRVRLVLAAVILVQAGAAVAAAAKDYSARVITSPPAALVLDPFYRRYIDAAGLPIVSSGAVPDAALLAARDIATAMLIERPDILHTHDRTRLPRRDHGCEGRHRRPARAA